jgi:hypothetical protein
MTERFGRVGGIDSIRTRRIRDRRNGAASAEGF